MTSLHKYTEEKINKDIQCISHCSSNIFSFQPIFTCPLCHKQIGDSSSIPFRLPSPFAKASQHPCSIVLRPTQGTFLDDFGNSSDLHIAVTTSDGDLVEFNIQGLKELSSSESNKEWSSCLVIESVPQNWHSLWDEKLSSMCNDYFWKSAQYHEQHLNCYSFVLSFLESLCYGDLSKNSRDKNVFSQIYVIPKTVNAAKYISTYRQVVKNGVFINR
ncbi:MKRN2OS family protein [Megaselia abdita]